MYEYRNINQMIPNQDANLSFCKYKKIGQPFFARNVHVASTHTEECIKKLYTLARLKSFYVQ